MDPCCRAPGGPRTNFFPTNVCYGFCWVSSSSSEVLDVGEAGGWMVAAPVSLKEPHRTVAGGLAEAPRVQQSPVVRSCQVLLYFIFL